jgi:hypothetical protein
VKNFNWKKIPPAKGKLIFFSTFHSFFFITDKLKNNLAIL